MRRKPLFVTSGNHYRKPQPIEGQSCGAKGDIYKMCPHRKLREHCRTGGQKYSQSQRIREFAVGLCLLVTSEDTHRVSPTQPPGCERSKDRQIKLDRKNPKRHQVYTKSHEQLRNTGSGSRGLPPPRGEHTNCPVPSVLAMKIDTQVTS